LNEQIRVNSNAEAEGKNKLPDGCGTDDDITLPINPEVLGLLDN